MRCTHRAVIWSTRQITTLVLGTDQGGKNVRDQTTTAFWSRPHIARNNTFWNIIDLSERRIRNVRDPCSRKDIINIKKKNSINRSVNDNYLFLWNDLDTNRIVPCGNREYVFLGKVWYGVSFWMVTRKYPTIGVVLEPLLALDSFQVAPDSASDDDDDES